MKRPRRSVWPPGFWNSSLVEAPADQIAMTKHRIFTTSFASVYPHYVAKAEKKGRAKAEVDEIIRCLTGFSQEQLDSHLAQR